MAKLLKNKVEFLDGSEVIVQPTFGHVIKARKQFPKWQNDQDNFDMATWYAVYLACQREGAVEKEESFNDFAERLVGVNEYLTDEEVIENLKEAQNLEEKVKEAGIKRTPKTQTD